jgi:hypothetical protein
LDHPELEFSDSCSEAELWTTQNWSFTTLIMIAGWLGHRDLATGSGAYCRSIRGLVPHDIICANLHLFLRVGKTEEPMSVEAFRPEARIDRFDERIVGCPRRYPCSAGP